MPNDDYPSIDEPLDESQDIGDSCEPSFDDVISWYGDDSEYASAVSRLKSSFERTGEDPLLVRGHVGGYRLQSRMGVGGMGTVYRAIDTAQPQPVAIKVLHKALANRPDFVSRFHKEARLHAEVDSPYVTKLLAVGEDRGLHYLVLGLVDGDSLAELLSKHRRFDERTALKIISHVALGLAELHRLGIVHRDVKPANIMVAASVLQKDPAFKSDLPVGSIKLTDFGLARNVIQPESLDVTRVHSILGTPNYSAPEQFDGNRAIDPSADVYAVAATLFHMLTGRTMFDCSSILELLEKHRHTRPPSVNSLVTSISEGLSRVIAKSLEKNPGLRYTDAMELSVDIDHLLRGEPTDIHVHPRFEHRESQFVQAYDLTCELRSSASELWPYVSDTDRINRAVQLPPVRYTNEIDADGQVNQYGHVSFLGMRMRWHEHPFEWIEGQRFSILREFENGPFKWVESTVTTYPNVNGGTTLQQRFRVQPRGIFGKALAAIQVGQVTRRAFARVYRRIDMFLCNAKDRANRCDTYVPSPRLNARQRQRIDDAITRLASHPINADILMRLAEYVAQADSQALAWIRPIDLAKRWSVPSDQAIAALLFAARERLLLLRWDIHCPICRAAAMQRSTLSDIETHGHCEVCNADFKTDFSHFVELVFSVHPTIRKAEARTYCSGGPAHSPHIIAQVRLKANEQLHFELSLCEGTYRMRSPQLSQSLSFRVAKAETPSRLTARLNCDRPELVPIAVSDTEQLLAIRNEFARDILLRVERTTNRDDVVTAAMATSMALFRKLFPSELVGFDRPASLERITILTTQVTFDDKSLRALGDAEIYQRIQQHFEGFGDQVADQGGALIKTVGNAALAVFAESRDAVSLAMKLPRTLGEPLKIRAAVHAGSAVLVNVNGKLEYLGKTIQSAMSLAAQAQEGELILTRSIVDDPAVQSQLDARGLILEWSVLGEVDVSRVFLPSLAAD